MYSVSCITDLYTSSESNRYGILKISYTSAKVSRFAVPATTKSMAPVCVSSMAFWAEPKSSFGNIWTSYLSPSFSSTYSLNARSPRCSGCVSDCAWETRIIRLPPVKEPEPVRLTATAIPKASAVSFFIIFLTLLLPFFIHILLNNYKKRIFCFVP